MKNLKDKVVFITGGARGLGYAMAEKFAAEGAKIVIGDIQEALAMESAEKIQKEFGVETYAFQMDVTSVENIKAAFAKVKEHFGKLDVQVNCAGIQIRCPTSHNRGTVIILAHVCHLVNYYFTFFRHLLRVSLNAEETVTVFPALFFYPKAGGRRLKH